MFTSVDSVQIIYNVHVKCSYTIWKKIR